jgi:hypothetical protein
MSSRPRQGWDVFLHYPDRWSRHKSKKCDKQFTFTVLVSIWTNILRSILEFQEIDYFTLLRFFPFCHDSLRNGFLNHNSYLHTCHQTCRKGLYEVV